MLDLYLFKNVCILCRGYFSFDFLCQIKSIVILESNHVFSIQRDSLNVSGEEDELPKSIIVTNVDLSVFDNLDVKVSQFLTTILAQAVLYFGTEF